MRAVEREPLPAVERAYDAPADEPAENPIDFEALRRESPDVYAWLYVPNTNVNLPVLQRPGDDFFYLDHDRYGEPAVEGAVFFPRWRTRPTSPIPSPCCTATTS